MIKIYSDFIGSFKLGDNIVFNFQILGELYDIQNAAAIDKKPLMRKPIIITIASIAEAVLFDLYLKINSYTNEGVPNIPDEVLNEIRTKTIDEFAKYIDNAKSKGLLGASGKIYDDLHELRKLRNRIHIQNTKNHFEAHEYHAFSSKRQQDAEVTLQKLLKYMETNYTRATVRGHVEDFVLPWD